MTKELHDLLEEIFEIPNAIGADLETGSHHFNNTASAEFARRYKHLSEALNRVHMKAKAVEDKYERGEKP